MERLPQRRPQADSNSATPTSRRKSSNVWGWVSPSNRSSKMNYSSPATPTPKDDSVTEGRVTGTSMGHEEGSKHVEEGKLEETEGGSKVVDTLVEGQDP